jgi:hypothetical protein
MNREANASIDLDAYFDVICLVPQKISDQKLQDHKRISPTVGAHFQGSGDVWKFSEWPIVRFVSGGHLTLDCTRLALVHI